MPNISQNALLRLTSKNFPRGVPGVGEPGSAKGCGSKQQPTKDHAVLKRGGALGEGCCTRQQ